MSGVYKKRISRRPNLYQRHVAWCCEVIDGLPGWMVVILVWLALFEGWTYIIESVVWAVAAFL